MAFDLVKEYKTLLDKRFTQKSLTDQFTSHDYDWTGANTIAVWTIDNMPTYTYTKTGSNRFTNGSFPTNIGGETNEYTLSHDISFSGIIENYDNADRKSILKANAIMKQQWDEVLVPEQDKYRLNVWANGAGIVETGSALTSSTIIRKILTAQAKMNNHLVGREGRVCFITESMAVECELADELRYNDAYTTKSIVNGQVSQLGSLPIVAVPDDYMPSGINFMIKWKRASVDPQKLKLLRVLPEVQGIYGPVLEGLVRHDSFVLAQKAYGIYCYGLTANVTPAPTASLVSSNIHLASTDSSAVIKYTDDGTNPKVSSTAQTFSSDITKSSSNKLLRIYAASTGKLASGIVEVYENDIT